MTHNATVVLMTCVLFAFVGCGSQTTKVDVKQSEPQEPASREDQKAAAEWQSIVDKVKTGCKDFGDYTRANTPKESQVFYCVTGSTVQKSDSLKYPYNGFVFIGTYRPPQSELANIYCCACRFTWDREAGKWICTGTPPPKARFLKEILKYTR